MEGFEAFAEGDGGVGAADPNDGGVEVGEGPLGDHRRQLAAVAAGLGGFVAEVSLTPVLAVTNGRDGAIAGAAIAVPMIVKRVLGNARPPAGQPPASVYLHRLLFDHDPAPGTPGTS